MEHSEFVRSFRRAAAVAVFVTALGASLVVGTIVYNVMLENFTRSIQAGIVNLASNAMKGGVTTENAEGVKQLEGVITPLLQAESYTQVVVYDANGDVVFGDSLDGPDAIEPPEPDDIARALKGETVTHVEPNMGQDALNVIAPLKGPEGKPAPGALSGHRPLMLFLEGALETIALLVGSILLFSAIAYLIIWHFTSEAARELARHQDMARTLQERLGASMNELERQTLGTLQALSSTVDAKDAYTARHSLNVADYACAIARAVGREDLVPMLERAGLLHDLGKVGVPEGLLQKPGSLTETEFTAVTEHSRLGAGIIETIPFLRPIVPAVLHHHERWDGAGYPAGLAGEEIPLEARILALADAFDAMTTSRPYSPAMPMSVAIAEVQRCSGRQFDPSLVRALVSALSASGIEFLGDPAESVS